MSRLGDFSNDSNPDTLRSALEAYYRLLDACDALPPEPGLRGLIAKCAVRAEITDAIDKIRNHLSRIAKRGGQGFQLHKAVTP